MIDELPLSSDVDTLKVTGLPEAGCICSASDRYGDADRLHMVGRNATAVRTMQLVHEVRCTSPAQLCPRIPSSCYPVLK